MGVTIKKGIRKMIVIMLLSFVALFLFRLSYGYTKPVEALVVFDLSDSFETSMENRKNYASKKYNVIAGATPQKIDQKYEKIAEITSKTSRFEIIEKQLRTEISEHQGLIQFENKSGNTGFRKLNLVVGVPPENFDAIYEKLIKIGKVLTKQITKKDKTNEYKELNAKKASLQKIKASLLELKSKSGKIEEYMQLENRILEIDQQLQELGVSLGNFDDENEFCTVKFSLTEGQQTKIGILQRIKVALEWTIKTYLKLLAILLLITTFSYVTLLGIEKLKLLQKINKGLDG